MERLEQIFKNVGAVLEGHFLLSSGLHSSLYWEKFKILGEPRYLEEACRHIAQSFRGYGVQAVAGPALGGIILAYEVARQLNVRAIFAEKESGRKVFRRAQSLQPGERVLIVDDVLTTGGSLREMVSAVEERGGRVVGIGVLVDRSVGRVDFGVPFFACLRVEAPVYRPEECPLCRQGLPLIRPGSEP